MASETVEKKTRIAKVRTPLELELYAAHRVGAVLEGMTLKQRARVLALVQSHTQEAIVEDPRQQALFTASVETF